ncbi:MAG TPA: class I SAM-dependent methyltransferase [Fimbriimonadaceae bacterium]|nr:class I SAM-dependent methyltransferase [Fimbriimonadaceae bacterium]
MAKILEHAARYGYALGGSFYLYTVGAFVPRHRLVISQVARHFGYRALGAPRPALPEVDLAEIVPPGTPIRLHEMAERDGNVSLYELICIATLAASLDLETAFEIGTFNGRTTLNIAANARPDSVTHTLDLPAVQLSSAALELDSDDNSYILKERSGELFQSVPEADRIRQLYGDSATFDFTPYENAVDFVFVDGSHSHDYVLSDSRNALRMLRGGKGAILWHDYSGWDGVTRALNELYASGGPWAGLRHIRGTTLACLIIR